jgi:hypothetical protein
MRASQQNRGGKSSNARDVAASQLQEIRWTAPRFDRTWGIAF